MSQPATDPDRRLSWIDWVYMIGFGSLLVVAVPLALLVNLICGDPDEHKGD